MRFYASMQIAFAALVALAGFLLWRYFQGKSALEIGRDLKEKTPLGIPSRAIDQGLSAATGREETLGGWLAEMFDPTTRAANRMLNTPVLPHERAAPDYATPPYFEVSP